MATGCQLESGGSASAEDSGLDAAVPEAEEETAAPLDTSSPSPRPDAVPEVDAPDVSADSTVGEADGGDASDASEGSPTTAPCTEPGAKMLAGHCYWLTSVPKSYADAATACASAVPAGHLATITSPAEQATVVSLFVGGDLWIGLSKEEGTPFVKASFQWATGEAVTYDDWDVTEPNGSGNCARIKKGDRWADWPCADLFLAVCERE